MLVAEIVQLKFLIRNLVHGGAAICNSAHLVGITFFPPIQRRSDVHRYVNHAHKLCVVRTSRDQLLHEIKVIYTNYKLRILSAAFAILIFRWASVTPTQTPLAVALIPAVHRVAHSPDSCIPAEYLCVCNLNHIIHLLLLCVTTFLYRTHQDSGHGAYQYSAASHPQG